MKLFSHHKNIKQPTQPSIAEFLDNIKNTMRQNYMRLNSDDWAIAHNTQCAEIKQQITSDAYLNEWTCEIERLTRPGQHVIEIGCALGATSLYLAKRGRIITGLDYSRKMCKMFQENASELGLKVKSICADITKKLPIVDNTYDVVWHAGVIEHFSDDEVKFIISENARVSRGTVISMAPNANSLAYRIGKEFAEKNGCWHAGEENPKYTQKDLFITAGLHNVHEYSIDMNFALAFLPPSLLKDALTEIYNHLPTNDDIHQGYLLVTIGEKHI